MLIDFLSKYIKDRKGIKFYAKSHVDAVYTRDGGKLGDKIEELENATDPNSHTHSNKTVLDSITQSRVQNWDNKVDKVNGMGLSQENYTTEEKERLKNLTNFNDTGLSERISVLEGTVPNLATKEYVSQEVANSNSLKKSIVEVVPTDEEAVDNVIYMVKQTDSEGNVKYQQYLKIDGVVQFIGDTDIDLEGYAKTNDVNEALDSKLNNTDIVDNLLSSESDKALSAKQGKELKTVIDVNKNDADNHKNDLSAHMTSEEKININNHINNSDIHMNEEEKNNITSHLNNSGIHMSETDRVKLHEHTNKSLLDNLLSSGDGLKYLANDGTYKELFVKSTTEPTDENSIWIDISDNTNILLKIFNDGSWNTISGSGGSSSSGSSITIDDILDATSTNPVQNKVIKEYIDTINTDIENIKTEIGPRVLYNKFKNTELDYGMFSYYNKNGLSVSVGQQLAFNSKDSRIECDIETGIFKLKGGRRYFIGINLRTMKGSCLYELCKNNDNNIICSGFKNASDFVESTWSDKELNCIISESEDQEYRICIGEVYNTCKISSYELYIVEIGRETVIDPVEYVNTTQGIEDTPVGHIISHMGTTAPAHYLICDGTEYNISDYPYLAQHFVDQFGSVNYFGGDGITTFSVPDLRGEFLRGTGNNSHTNQGSGDDVGIHQDATEHLNLHLNQYKYITLSIDYNKNSNTIGQYNIDSNADITHSPNAVPYVNTVSGSEDYIPSHYTSRPTNTSVLYCIKYEPTYYMNIDNCALQGYENYSEDEQIIGRWVNGKPLYRRCCKLSEISDYTDYINCVISNIKNDNYKPLVPILTSRVSDDYDTIYNTESNDSWSYNAFDGGTSVPELSWYSNSLDAYLGIHFKTKKVIVTKIELVQEIATPCYFKDYQFQASNNGVDWIVLGIFSTDKFVAGNVVENGINNNEAYEYYRVYFTSQGTGSVNTGVSVQNMQFYGYEEKTNVYEYTKITDNENSFTPDMLPSITINSSSSDNSSSYTDEEIEQMVSNIFSDSSTSGNGNYTDEEIREEISNILGGAS